jgi:hypothetical protein
MGLTPRDHTRAVLNRMQLASSVPANLERDKDAVGDNYGLTSARSSDSSSFKLSGAPKSPHMGRPGRQAGGRIAGDLIRTRRTPEETAKDIANEDKVIDSLAKDREGRAHGGRTNKGKTTVNVIIGGDKGGPPAPPPMPPPPMAAPGPVGPPPPRPPMGGMPMPMPMPVGGAPMGGAGPPPPGGPPMPRARGGRIGRQIGGAMPPAPGVASPLARPAVPGLPPAAMPGTPPGAAQAPMMRAKGGRIEIDTPGHHDYGKPGVKHGSTNETYGGGSGLGRQERARHQK